MPEPERADRPDDLRGAVESAPFAVSPWLVAQLPQLSSGVGSPR